MCPGGFTKRSMGLCPEILSVQDLSFSLLLGLGPRMHMSELNEQLSHCHSQDRDPE